MSSVANNIKPDIFVKIIETRIAEYIDKEVKELIRKKTGEIVQEVLSSLQLDAEMFKDMRRFEETILIKAVYNGQDITQKQEPKQ